ncbi:hypothetical protein ACFSYD_12640 [Paracoccus aerius]
MAGWTSLLRQSRLVVGCQSRRIIINRPTRNNGHQQGMLTMNKFKKVALAGILATASTSAYAETELNVVAPWSNLNAYGKIEAPSGRRNCRHKLAVP